MAHTALESGNFLDSFNKFLYKFDIFQEQQTKNQSILL